MRYTRAKEKGLMPLESLTIHIKHIHGKTGQVVWTRKKLGKRRLESIINPKEGMSSDDVADMLKMSYAECLHIKSEHQKRLISDSPPEIKQNNSEYIKENMTNGYTEYVNSVYDSYTDKPLCSSSYRKTQIFPTHYYNSNEINIRNR